MFFMSGFIKNHSYNTFFIRKHNFYECLCALYFLTIFTIIVSCISFASVTTLIPIIIIETVI